MDFVTAMDIVVKSTVKKKHKDRQTVAERSPVWDLSKQAGQGSSGRANLGVKTAWGGDKKMEADAKDKEEKDCSPQKPHKEVSSKVGWNMESQEKPKKGGPDIMQHAFKRTGARILCQSSLNLF